jgi:hypothetical protein
MKELTATILMTMVVCLLVSPKVWGGAPSKRLLRITTSKGRS